MINGLEIKIIQGCASQPVIFQELLTLLFKVVSAKVKYETLGEMVHVPLATPERRLQILHLMSRKFPRLSSVQIFLYRADFSEPAEPVAEPEATFVWKGERGGGLKLDKVSLSLSKSMS